MTLHDTGKNEDPAAEIALDALKATKGSAWLNRNVLGMGLASLFSDWSHEMMTAILPLFLVSIGASATALGTIEGVADAASSFVKLWAGHRTDRTGTRKPLTVIGYIMTAGMALFALANNWYEVLAVRIFGWTGRGMRGPLRDAMLADAAPKDAYGRVFGFHRAMDTAGAVLGPISALFLIRAFGHSTSSFRTIFLIALAPALLAVGSIWGLVNERRRMNVHAMRFRAAVSALPPKFKWFTGAVGIFGLGNFAHSLLILYVIQILTPDLGELGAGTVAVSLYTLHNILYSLISFPAGALSDRIGKRPLLIAGYALFGFMCLGFIWTATSMVWLIVLFAIAGIYIALVDSMEGSFAAEMLPEHLRGTGYGVLSTVNGIGDFASSFIVGLLWTNIAPAAGFIYSAILSILGAVVLLGVGRKGNISDR